MKKNFSAFLKPLGGVVFMAVLTAGFVQGVGNLSRDSLEEGRCQLERSIRRAAVSCYASEGAYPQDISVIEERYGIQIDRERYTVYYEIFASNLMPDITVLGNK